MRTIHLKNLHVRTIHLRKLAVRSKDITTQFGNIAKLSENIAARSGNITAASENLPIRYGNVDTRSENISIRPGNITTRPKNTGTRSVRLRPIRNLCMMIFPALTLAACAGSVSPPAVSYDNNDFKPAVLQPDAPRPVRIVTMPEPLPLPGQLMPPPSASAARGGADKLPPTQRVDAANAAALQQPATEGYINAIQVYPFTAGALYRLYAAPEQVTDIALQPGETLVSVSAGDTVRWVVGNTSSGTGASRQVHILVKPFAPGLTTNLIIMTDRRSYHLELESTEHTAMAAISWTYPEDQLFVLQQQNAQADAAQPVAGNVVLANLDFRYAISGDTPPSRPIRAFDDGSKVYIEFPERIDQGEMPPLFVIGPQGDDQLVSYRVRGNYYIVDRLFAAAELRLGTAPQQIVRITRTDTNMAASVAASSEAEMPRAGRS